MTPELLSFVSFSAGVILSCTLFVFVLRGRVIISREAAEIIEKLLQERQFLKAELSRTNHGEANVTPVSNEFVRSQWNDWACGHLNKTKPE